MTVDETDVCEVVEVGVGASNGGDSVVSYKASFVVALY